MLPAGCLASRKKARQAPAVPPAVHQVHHTGTGVGLAPTGGGGGVRVAAKDISSLAPKQRLSFSDTGCIVCFQRMDQLLVLQRFQFSVR